MNTPETCYYCGKNLAVGQAAFMCPMYRETVRKLFNKFERIQVAVPRCQECRSIHGRSRRQTLLIGYVISLLLFLYPIGMLLNRSAVLAACLLWVGWAVANILGENINRWHFNRRVIPHKFGIKNQENVHMAESIKKMQRMNWSLRDPSLSD